MIKKWGIFFIFLFCACGLWAKDIVIYHTSDIHGHYFSENDDNGRPYGGFARLAALLKSTKTPFLLLDSGDFSSGSYEANISNGKYSIDLMNRMGYAALTIGNHDSDFGDVGLGNMLSEFEGDVLAMNVSVFQIPNKPIKSYTLYKVGDIKVGVIGVARDGSGAERMQIVNAPTVEEFENSITALKEKGAEVIIVNAHDSLVEDSTVSVDKRSDVLAPIRHAPSFKDVDLILGGHAHMQTRPRKLADGEGRGPWVLEDEAYLKSVSATVISKNRWTGKITVKEPKFIALNGKEDPEIKKYLDSIRSTQLDDKLYATVPTLISKYPSPEQEDRAPGVARLFADQMYEAIKGQEQVDLTAFSLNTVRNDYKPGDMTGRYLAEMAPYKEHAGTFNITGRHLLKAMNESLGFRDGRCYSVYGYSKNVRMTILCDQQQQLATLQQASIGGVPIDPSKMYRMAMLTHLPQGYYEGKPFKVVDPSNPQKNSIIKHYYAITNADMLFGIVDRFKKEQGVDVPLFKAPSDVQIKEVMRTSKVEANK